MATTKKTTTKKAAPAKRAPINLVVLRKDVVRIDKLRSALYKKYNNRWQNSYGKDKFIKAINALKEAGMELGDMY